MTAAVEAARTTARILLEIEAVHFRPQQPFILTSGRASPVYIDCRKIIAFPRARAKIIDLAVATIEREIGFESLDAIAGGETAGIPFAAWIADRLGLPMLYVRKKPKGFGRGHRPAQCGRRTRRARLPRRPRGLVDRARRQSDGVATISQRVATALS